MAIKHAFVSALADDAGDAAAGLVVSSNWNADHDVDSLTLTHGTITADEKTVDASVTWNNAAVTFTALKLNVTDNASASTSLLADLQVGGVSKVSIDKAGTISFGVGAPALQLTAEDAAIGSIEMEFYNTDFSGVNDPVVFFGHNAGGAPSGATRFFMGIEGHYNDTVNSHIWSEFYIHRYDSDGTTNYRPFSVACYDGSAQVNFKADQLTFDHRSGTSDYGFGTISMSSNPYMYVKSAAKVLFGGNNQEQLKQAKSGGGYETIAYMNSSDEVSFSPNVNARMRTKLSVGSDITPTAKLHLGAGSTSASTAPLKLTSGSLMTAAEVGALEFLTDSLYFTITTGTARRTIGMLESEQSWSAKQTFTGKIVVSGGSVSAPSVDLSGSGITSGFWNRGAYDIGVCHNGKVAMRFNNTVFRVLNSSETQGVALDGQQALILFGASEDVGVARNAAGVVEVNSGTVGTLRDLKLRNVVGQTGYTEMAEMTAPSAPSANGVRIYAQDNGSGKTQLMALFASGAAQQLAIEP